MLPKVQRTIDAMRNSCTMDSPTISGCSLRIAAPRRPVAGIAALLRDPGTCWKARRPGLPRPVPSKLEAALPLGWGEAKDTGCGERSAGNRDKTPSRSLSCPEGQNFVSRARTTSLRSVLLPRLGGNTSSAIPPSPWAGSRVPPTSLPPNCCDQPVDNRTEPSTARQWIRYLVIAIIALFLVWWMLRVYVL